jgi:hypothetical protein
LLLAELQLYGTQRVSRLFKVHSRNFQFTFSIVNSLNGTKSDCDKYAFYIYYHYGNLWFDNAVIETSGIMLIYPLVQFFSAFHNL